MLKIKITFNNKEEKVLTFKEGTSFRGLIVMIARGEKMLISNEGLTILENVLNIEEVIE